MLRTFSYVESGWFYQPMTGTDPIIVGTTAWFDWLERHTAFTFVDQAGAFTALKRVAVQGDLVWEASGTQEGQRSHVVLGPSQMLTLSRLQAAAHTLAGQPGTGEPTAAEYLAPDTAASTALSHALFQTKLYRPRRGTDLISRPHLFERLNAGLGGIVTLVSAPAGFGKTTLLAEWVRTLDRPCAWLSLDEEDNDLRLFVHSLAAALRGVFPDAFQATASLFIAPQFPPPGRVANLLLSDLADAPDDVVLVLNDYHLIHTGEIHALLVQLIEQQPLQLHLVLSTRSDPPLPLARWRANGYLSELRRADLRFTLSETEAFLAGVLGKDLENGIAAALEARTDGWIAVMRLAALSLRSTADRAAFIERLGHSPDNTISDYLVEEVLAQLAPAVQELLVHTSILEQFCAELCGAVMGNDPPSSWVQATLVDLERSNLFLVPLDEHRGWYRFHPLFRQMLQQRMQARLSVEELAALHRRASAWYAGQGLIEEAIWHALAAGDAPGAMHLVEAQFFQAFEQEQLAQLEHWLGLLPEEQIEGSPVLQVSRAWILQAHGHLTDLPRVLTAAEQLVATGDSGTIDPNDRRSRLLRALIAIGWSQFQYFTGQVQASLQSARFALAWVPPGKEYSAVLATMFLATSQQAAGQGEMALVQLQQALRDHSTQLNSTARLLFAQGLVYLAAGKLHQAEHTSRHLLRLSHEADIALSQYWAHWSLGVVSYEWNSLDAAVYHFSAVIANQHLAHFWVVRDALCGLAFAYQAQGQDTQAREAARSLLAWVQDQHNMGELMSTYAFQGQLALLQDRVEEAQHWLELAGEQEALGPMIFFEDPLIIRARMHIARGDEPSVARGQALLTHLLQHVEAIHSTRKTIKVLTLQAWAYDVQGRGSEALALLERALILGRPGGFIRTFADVPALAKSLHELRKRRKARQEGDEQLEGYLQRILAAMRSVPAQTGSTDELLRNEGLEPLTGRELHVLRLLDKDLANKEIARELVVTPGTVKAHTNNVYRKLGVNNRHAAVTLAKALGLLTANQA
jgi:LuxR family maltose regulon positive regulatory protein